MIWDEETTSKLRKWRAEGVAVLEIANRLGVGRGAVTGRVSRLGIDKRVSPIGAARTPEKSAQIEELLRNGTSVKRTAKITHSDINYIRSRRIALGLPAWKPSAGRSVELRFESESPDPQVTLFDESDAPDPEPSRALPRFVVAPAKKYIPLTSPPCCWPIGEPRDKAFRFCGDASEPGRSYCDAHCRVAYATYRQRVAA